MGQYYVTGKETKRAPIVYREYSTPTSRGWECEEQSDTRKSPCKEEAEGVADTAFTGYGLGVPRTAGGQPTPYNALDVRLDCGSRPSGQLLYRGPISRHPEPSKTAD